MTRKFVRNKNYLSPHFDGMDVGGVYKHRPCTDTSGTIATPAILAKNYSHPSRSSHALSTPAALATTLAALD